MFVRIYSGIFLAILLSITVVYSTYQLNFNKRLATYSQSILQGSLVLISQGYQRQKTENKARWLALVAKMTGLNAKLSEIAQHRQEQWLFTITDDDSINIKMTYLNQKIELKLARIGEQQFRAIALLIVNELLRDRNLEEQLVISNVQQLFNFPIQLMVKAPQSLDQQQLFRLHKGDVVVSSVGQGYSVYIKAPSGKILHVGKIEKFETLSLSLLILLITISLSITSLAVYLLVFRLEKRLSVVSQIVEGFGHNKVANRVVIKGNDVITRLGLQVNDMANRIEQLLVNQKNITQAVSHELRTPLARIRFRLQLIEDSNLISDDVDEVSQTVARNGQLSEKVLGIRKDIDQLEALIDEMLCLYKLDIEPNEYQKCSLNIGDVVRSVIELNQINFPDIEVQLDSIVDVSAYCNAQDLTRLLQNLLSNACKHANSQVEVTVQQIQNSFIIDVEDDGEGIIEEDRKRIFEPFTRINNARNKKIKGYGLGLAIVARIAVLHEGQITVSESQLGGAKFRYSNSLSENHDQERQK